MERSQQNFVLQTTASLDLFGMLKDKEPVEKLTQATEVTLKADFEKKSEQEKTPSSNGSEPLRTSKRARKAVKNEDFVILDESEGVQDFESDYSPESSSFEVVKSSENVGTKRRTRASASKLAFKKTVLSLSEEDMPTGKSHGCLDEALEFLEKPKKTKRKKNRGRYDTPYRSLMRGMRKCIKRQMAKETKVSFGRTFIDTVERNEYLYSHFEEFAAKHFPEEKDETVACMAMILIPNQVLSSPKFYQSKSEYFSNLVTKYKKY